jgi:hypothetical protein
VGPFYIQAEMAKRTKKILVKYGNDKQEGNSEIERRKSNKKKTEKRKEENSNITKIENEKPIRNTKKNRRYRLVDNYRDMEKDYRYRKIRLVKTILKRRIKYSDGKVQKLIRCNGSNIREKIWNLKKENKKGNGSTEMRVKITRKKETINGKTGINIGWHVGKRERGRQSTKDTQRTPTHERNTSKKVAYTRDGSDRFVNKKVTKITYGRLAQYTWRETYCYEHNFNSEVVQIIVYNSYSLMPRICITGTYLKKLVISITDIAKNRLKATKKFVVKKMAENRDIHGKLMINNA